MRMTGTPDANPPAPKERKKPGRVPTSCAECRRLKLRCDRKVPCENCSKRGCGSICPTGSLTTGKGNRLILTSTEELHNKIDTMSARIRELEEALVEKSHEPHPLLSGTVPPKAPSGPARVGSALNEPESDHVIDAFGTLTIGARGETSFMSSTARSEFLVGRPLWKAPTWATLVQELRLPARVINASMLEHDVTPVDHELRELVMSHRPPPVEAIRLCEVYLDWGNTLWNPLSRQELFEEIVGSVYSANSYEAIPGPHALSLLFSILALASLFDSSRPAYSIEACEYYILSRVALEFNSPCATTTLQTVFALGNHIQWLDLSNVQMDPSWTYNLIGLGVKLAYQIGLHLHSARFRLEKRVVQQRSVLFWQMFLMDTLLSFYAGRPPSVSLDWIDAPYPDDEFPVRNDKGVVELSYRSWSWRFAKLLHEVLVAAFGAKIPTYKMILELDRRIRDFPIPSHLQLHSMSDGAGDGPHVVLQRLLVLTMKESVLLNIHRRYFSQALQDSPTDPLKHRYGPSVMSMYRSAWRLIVSHTSAVEYIPDVAARIPIFWSQALSAAIVMCMIVTHAPNSTMAASSLHEVDVVYEVFKKAVPTTRIASVLEDHVEKVWRISHESHCPFSESTSSRAELDRVGGGSTRLISKTGTDTRLSASPASSSPDASTPCSNPSPPSSDASSWSMHPRLMQDMAYFDGFRASEPSSAQAAAAATTTTTYAPPEHFSQSLIDTQLSHFCLETEARMAKAALNTFYPGQPQPFHPAPADTAASTGATTTTTTTAAAATAAAEVNPGLAQSVSLDSAWQSFMEQLGF